MEARTSWKHGRDLSGSHSRVHRHHDSFHPDPRDIDSAIPIIERAIEYGGVTICRDYQPVTFDGGAIVGGKYPGIRLDAAQDTGSLAYALHRYVVQSPTWGEPTFVGLWFHDGELHIDTVTHHANVIDALRIARERGQIAVYDCWLHQDLFVRDYAYDLED